MELRTDKGDYLPGEVGVGALDVYGYGPTHLVVTATNGTTLLDIQPELAGYQTLTFTIPTTPTGDYLLLANSHDPDNTVKNFYVGAQHARAENLAWDAVDNVAA